MQLHNGPISSVKSETADVRALLHARIDGNEHARVSTNGHVRNGNGHRRRVRRQIRHGQRQAARKADTAVILVETCGMSVTEAIARCNTSPGYYSAMKTLRDCGDHGLHAHVLKGDEPVLASAKRVKNAATVIAAYQKCSELEKGLIRLATGATADAADMLWHSTPEQLVATTKALGLDFVWDRMIEPAMPTEPTAAVQEAVNASRCGGSTS